MNHIQPSNYINIRTIRLARNIGQRELAEKSSVSRAELSKCERGLILPDEEFFDAVASVLSVSAKDLRTAHERLLHEAIPGEGYVTANSEEHFVLNRRLVPAPNTIPIWDLFCGTGGFSHGFEQTGRFQVTVGIDLLPDRIRTFSANHPSATAVCDDIRQTPTASLIDAGPRPQVIIGGPPCQGFSSLRPFRTLTENDPRNNLVERFALAVDAIRPDWFIFENVVGLLTHIGGTSLQTIVKFFAALGYSTDWRILNGALYGLPQRRERLIIVGNCRGKNFPWPPPTHYFNGKSMAGKIHGQVIEQTPLFGSSLPLAITVMDALHDLPAIQAGGRATVYRDDVQPTEYEQKMRGTEQILTLHEATAHSTRMLEIIKQAGHNRNALPKHLTSSGFSSSYSRLEPDLPSVTLTVNFVHPASNKCIHPTQDRALTPREGARLQGFGDSYKFVGGRAQIVKQIGNAVPPILGRVIAEALLRGW